MSTATSTSTSIVSQTTDSSTLPASAAAPTTTKDGSAPGVVEQYQRYLPLAHKLPTAQVRRVKIPVSLALLNAARGAAALMERRDEVAALPGIAMDQIDALPMMGQALQYAAGRIERFVPITGEIKAMLSAASKQRANLLAKADVLVIDGVVPAETVAGIRKGRGPMDVAGDCVALAALFHEHTDALAGHVSVSPADIHAANDIGAKLLAALHPDAATRAPDKEHAAAIDTRDRLWTLFEQTWIHNVWRPAVWLYGLEAEDHVPRLGARTHRRTAKAAPVAAAPSAGTTTSSAASPAPTATPTAAPHV